MALDLPVTLVIKAPNQRIEDHTVDCFPHWTVKKLKQHLTSVYPSKPSETQQKLIYSGKLLQDHLTLKDVLLQFDDGSTKHTVHLVCAGSPHMEAFPRPRKEASHVRHDSSSSEQSRSSSASPVMEQEGLRYRPHATQPAPSATSEHSHHHIHAANMYSAYMQQMLMGGAMAGQGGAAMYGGGMMPPQGAYSPEQYAWMQQMYSQYMSQYMQLYQGHQQTSQVGSGSQPDVQPAAGGAPQQAPEMAAGAMGEEVDNGDDEFRQRDWLDYVYTFSRFMVLLGIVYFYSSLTRFLMVGAFFALVYAYQMGWFILHRRPHHENAPEQRQQQQQQQRPEENQPQQQPDDTIPEEESTPQPPEAPVEPPAPGILSVTWTFFSTFVTSLFPSPPPAVNVN